MNLRNAWNSLNPKHKRWLVITGIAAALAMAIGAFSPSNKGKAKKRANDGLIAHVLTDTDTRKVTIDALDANVKSLQDDRDRLRKDVERLNRELETEKKKRDEGRVERQLETLRTEMEQMKRQAAPVAGAEPAGSLGPVIPDAAKTKADEPFEIRVISEDVSAVGNVRNGAPRNGVRSANKRAAADDKSSNDLRVYLPPGTILTGTILTGLDAPTGQAARRDPFPVVVRIQKEAILPNYFRADVRECFVLMSGYGDLSSERAYLRGEALSCVRRDGKVIDIPLPSYAAGEDGKAGVRGRLVSKQGAMIGRAMVAGFLEAFSSVFQRAAVPTINLSSSDTTAFQKVLSSQSAQTGAVAGVGKALDRLAQYYIDMAEQMFPVIEVDAGREIDVVVTSGTALKLVNGNAE